MATGQGKDVQPQMVVAQQPQMVVAQQPQMVVQTAQAVTQPMVQVQVLMQQPFISAQNCGRTPVAGQCPLCKQQTVTQVHYENGSATWIGCLGLALCGCWLGCCVIPFCVDDMKDVHHTCSACQQICAVKTKM